MTLDLTAFRQRLTAELTRAHATLQRAGASGDIVALDQASVGRLSRMDALQQQAMALGLTQRVAVRIRRIEAALARLDADRFGLCCQCGSQIEPARLDADPTTVFCAGCQEDREAEREAR